MNCTKTGSSWKAIIPNPETNTRDTYPLTSDEIDLLERSWNAYQADLLGKDVKDLVGDERFSYRYAIGDWEERDDRIMEAANAALEGQEEQ